MAGSTVIIAHRRRGQDYWEGYSELLTSEAEEWVGYYRNLCRIVKVFPSMAEYRADCDKLLDNWEAKRKKQGRF